MTLAALVTPSQAPAEAAFLNAPELECLKALVDAIIPRTDTPGASDAGVPTYIDRRLAANPQLAESFRRSAHEVRDDDHTAAVKERAPQFPH